MSYAQASLGMRHPRLNANAPAVFVYKTPTDGVAVVDAAGYWATAADRGAKVGDFVLVEQTASGDVGTLHKFMSLSGIVGTTKQVGWLRPDAMNVLEMLVMGFAPGQLNGVTLSLGTAQLLAVLRGANMNSTADQPFQMLVPFTAALIQPGNIRVGNASTSLTTVAGGVYTAAAKGGVAVIAAATAYSALTGPGLGIQVALTAAGANELTLSQFYLSLTTPQGAAATADFFISGIPTS